jgi:dimethylhistidine N-methyltransferase
VLPLQGRAPPSRLRVLVHNRTDAEEERRKMLACLLERPARTDPKYFYDPVGSALYGAITGLPEYYLTRVEAGILRDHRDAICAELPRHPQWIDLGCGDGAKAAGWLRATAAQRYVGVDIAEPWLRATLANVSRAAGIEAVGVVTDLSMPWSLQDLVTERASPPVFFYPGSSIGNFVPAMAVTLLRNIRAHCDGGCLLIGVDFIKDRARLHAAYDDALGVTAAFNRNVLRVVNRHLDADFQPQHYTHAARFNEVESRMEMHLVSRRPQRVRFGSPPLATRNFGVGETIITEYSYKYTAQCFADMLNMAGFSRQRLWTDTAGGRDTAAYGVFLAAP